MIFSNIELRSLKRKQVPNPALSSQQKRVHMDAPDIFEEFHSTVNEVLHSCTDHGVILNALKDLAEGKRAALSDGIRLQPLRGLGSQPRATTPEKKYEKTMSVLLSWGIRTFPVQPSQLVDGLWVLMTIFDGPKGYNQRLAEQLTPRSRTLTDHCY
jgi:hypothetical protein